MYVLLFNCNPTVTGWPHLLKSPKTPKMNKNLLKSPKNPKK